MLLLSLILASLFGTLIIFIIHCRCEKEINENTPNISASNVTVRYFLVKRGKRNAVCIPKSHPFVIKAFQSRPTAFVVVTTATITSTIGRTSAYAFLIGLIMYSFSIPNLLIVLGIDAISNIVEILTRQISTLTLSLLEFLANPNMVANIEHVRAAVEYLTPFLASTSLLASFFNSILGFLEHNGYIGVMTRASEIRLEEAVANYYDAAYILAELFWALEEIMNVPFDQSAIPYI